MEFRVLGPIEVVASGQPVPIRGSRERAILARLLVSANQTVARDTLVADLWPDEPPEGATHALWVYVSRLRKALREAGGEEVLLTRPPGYLLAADPETVDAARFEALVREAQPSALAGRHAEAAATLADALALWRGPAYAGITELPFAQAEAIRLEDARIGAIEARIEADLAAGSASELIGELASLTRQHPLRERLWALRMTALYRAGRQAEALRVYQELRRYLGEELGIEPSEEVRALEGAILRHEARLSGPRPAEVVTAELASRPGGPGVSAGRVVTSPFTDLPVALARQDTSFVRPEADMAQLEAAWQAARSGRRQLVLLAGEPGIGKTRLSAEIARTAHESGAAVLYGRCDEAMGVPYQPFVEALSTYLRPAPAAALGRLGGELVRLVPEVGEWFPDLPAPLSADPETERYRLFEAVAAWLAAVAAESPTLLVLDDFHWATPATLAMLRHVVRSGEPGGLVLVVNYRDTPLDMTPEMADAVADLLRQPDVNRLRLEGLDHAGVAAYIEAQARHDLDPEGQKLADVLYAETAGNPFFLNQLLRHMSETGALTRTDGRWSAPRVAVDIDIPDNVRDVIARRLARLPDETNDILGLAAVQGDQFDLRVLVEAAGQPQISVLRALDPAISARLITDTDGPVPGHRFVHALVRHTIEDALPTARRMELHRAVGGALAGLAGEAWPEHAADLARHWLAATPQVGAGPEEVRRIFDYVEEAARRASASLAYEEAATRLARALPLAGLIDDPARRAAILVALGEARHNAGDSAHRPTLLQAGHLALELGDSALAARAALANQRPMSAFGAVDPERVAFLEAVLAALGPGDTPARARTLVALASELHFDDDPRRHELAHQAVAVARRLDDPACLADVLGVAGFALWEPGTLPDRLDIATELGGLADALGDPVLAVNANLAQYLTAAQHGDLDQARAALSIATQLADELGQPALRMRTAHAQAGCAMLDGRFGDVERHASDALRFGEALGNPDRVGLYHMQSSLVCLLRGQFAEAVGHMAAGVEQIPLVSAKLGLAWAYAEAGNLAEARAIIAAHGGASLSGVPHRVYTGLTNLAGLAAASAAVGDRELAHRLRKELLPCRHQMGVLQAHGVGPIAYYLGRVAALLGCPDEADEHFAFACELQERTGARGLLTQARLEWARLLLQRGAPGDGERSRELAAAAAELADELDTPVLAEQALDLLARSPAAG